MNELPGGGPPDPRVAAGPAEFVERLRELRLWAGEPPLRRLRQLAGTTVDANGVPIDALPTSTTSYLLRGERLPRMEFVHAFVTACLRARGQDQASVTAQVDRWHEAWLRVRGSRPPAPPPADPLPAGQPGSPVPRQLPLDVVGFTGRIDELALLQKVLCDAHPTGPPAPVAAIDGVGGVGKSALAIHAAHRLAGCFPDGQLYADLHGATAGTAPVEPLELLGRFLRALGVTGSEIPDQLDEAAAAFRTRVADRRLLLVLDNATDERQVRPLLPAAQRCRALVTSRQALFGLAGASQLHLDVLPEPDAICLLGRMVGEQRVAAEPGATAELALRCGHLPLALRIAGARLAARPAWPIAALADRLADERRRLAELRGAEAGVQASFDVSHQQLRDSDDATDQAAAAGFGLLGIWGGPDLALPVAARLLDRPDQEADRLLERLVDARLLETRMPGRYHLHDLLRLYARQQAALTYPEHERIAALARVLRFYVTTAWHTARLLHPGDRRHSRADGRWTTGGLEFADPTEALAWLDAERANLLAAATQAAAADELAPAATQLAPALAAFFNVRRYCRDWDRVNELAVEVARRTEDPAAEAQAYQGLAASHGVRGSYEVELAYHRRSLALWQRLDDRLGQVANLAGLGMTYAQLGRHHEAIEHLQSALSIRRQLDDPHGEATNLYSIGLPLMQLGRLDEAVGCLRRSLAMFRELGNQHGEASVWNGLATVYCKQERYEEALSCVQRSLELDLALGNEAGTAAGLDTTGTILYQQGRHSEALDHFQQSLAIWRSLHSRHEEAKTLRNAGLALQALGRTEQALDRWAEALTICEELRTPADDLHTLLAGAQPS